MDYSASAAEHAQDQPITRITPFSAYWKQAERYVSFQSRNRETCNWNSLNVYTSKTLRVLIMGWRFIIKLSLMLKDLDSNTVLY